MATCNKEDKTKVSDEELQNFKDNFEKNAEEYFQQIALKYLPKPMVFIKYVFLVYKNDKNKNGKLIPMVFNVKELTKEHEPILKHIERLISQMDDKIVYSQYYIKLVNGLMNIENHQFLNWELGYFEFCICESIKFYHFLKVHLW